MWTCPVPECGEKKKNAGAKQHMTKKHPDWVLVDSANLIYRAPTTKHIYSVPNKHVRKLKPELEPPTRKLRLPIETTYAPKPVEAPTTTKEIRRRVAIPKGKRPKRNLQTMITKAKARFTKDKDRPKKEFDPDWDPEPTLELVTKIPLLLILGIVAFKYLTDPAFFMQFLDNDVVELYKFVFTDITSPGAIIILALTAIILILLLVIVYKMIWRFMFKDLQIRKGFTDDGQKYHKGPGTSFEGRIMLVIGDGFWDGIYRKYTKRPKPKVMTVYFRRGFRDPSMLNPFKVLASCHKGYIDNTNGGRYIRDGLFKRTLIATHVRRDTEAESTVYWFDDDMYDPKPFTSDWYRDGHTECIKQNLSKVSKACLMDSTTQKRQMENVISWLPSSEIKEQERVWLLKEEAKLKSEG